MTTTSRSASNDRRAPITDPSTMARDVALVLVNGSPTSVQAPRARALFDGARIVFKEGGRVRSASPIWSAVSAVRSGWIYCIDLGFPPSLLAALRKIVHPRVKLAYELGDPAKPLFSHSRSRFEVQFAHALDRVLPVAADALVFRGSYLEGYFRGIYAGRRFPRSTWLPDGVDTAAFRPRRDDAEVTALRRAHGLENRLVVGIVGSLHDNPKLRMFYGWDLAEALAQLPRDLPITGVVVGDGEGRAALEAARDRLGLGDRLRLVGRVPHAQVPLWMNVFDVGLSTQTDDPVGWGRTTAKLPEYVACGTVVAATDVGEAHRWLRDSGQTLPYRGLRDDAYPARLAAHLRDILNRDLEPLRAHNRALALRLFDYALLREQLADFLSRG